MRFLAKTRDISLEHFCPLPKSREPDRPGKKGAKIIYEPSMQNQTEPYGGKPGTDCPWEPPLPTRVALCTGPMLHWEKLKTLLERRGMANSIKTDHPHIL